MIRSYIAAAIALAAAIGFSFLSVVLPAAAEAEIKVLSAVVMKSAVGDLAREFERATGTKVALAYAPSGAVRDRILGGEAFDLTILPRPVIEGLQTQGKIAATVRALSPALRYPCAYALERPSLTSKVLTVSSTRYWVSLR